MVIKKLKSVCIDVKNGIGHVEVNGKDISSKGSYLNLTFENGEWSLMTTRDEVYSTSDLGIKVQEIIKDNATSTNSIA